MPDPSCPVMNSPDVLSPILKSSGNKLLQERFERLSELNDADKLDDFIEDAVTPVISRILQQGVELDVVFK